MKETNYMKEEIVKSNKLGCNVHSFLTVKEFDNNKVQLLVTHIPVAMDDRRELVVSDETVDYAVWLKNRQFVIDKLVEI